MKYLAAALVTGLCLLSSITYAQYSFTTHKHKFFKKFLQSETIVPITGFDAFDAKLKKTLEDNWTFTPLKFVPIAEFGKYTANKNVSIIDLFSFEVDGALGNTSLSVYIPADLNESRLTNVIASVPIKCSFSGRKDYIAECGYEHVDYKIDILAMQLIEVINFTRTEKYKPTLAHITGISKYVNRYNEKSIKTKENFNLKPLLLSDAFFGSELEPEEFSLYYKGKYEIVNQLVYKERIEANDGKYLIVLHANLPNSLISVFDTETKSTRYIGLNFGKSPISSRSKMLNLTKKQVTDLNDHIEKLTAVD